jgi:hypothetical protein
MLDTGCLMLDACIHYPVFHPVILYVSVIVFNAIAQGN